MAAKKHALQVMEIRIKSEDFQNMPKIAREAILLASHALNELNILKRLVIFATNACVDEQPDIEANRAQATSMIRLHIGKLHETGKLYSRIFKKGPLIEKILPLLNDHERSEHDWILENFSQRTAASIIRQNYAFHHPLGDDLDKAFFDRDFVILFSEIDGNTFSPSAEQAVFSALDTAITRHAQKTSDPETTIDVARPLTEYSARATEILVRNIITILEIYHPELVASPSFYLRNAPLLDKTQLRLFVSDGPYPPRKKAIGQ